eukprot:94208_1
MAALLIFCTFFLHTLAFNPKVNNRDLRHTDLGPHRHQHHIHNILGSSFNYADTYTTNNSNPIIYVSDYGADPSGAQDSTKAINLAIAAATTRGAKNVSLANDIHDCGGAIIHLGGGDYSISSPIIIPQMYGNLRMVYGTLRASKSFTPTNSYLLIIGDDSKTKCSNSQGACNENVAIENMMFDGSHLVDGCVQVKNTMGFVVGPQMFFLGFNVAGVTVNGGHETMISNSWFGEFLYSSTQYKTAKATGIQLFGNDHYVTNTIIFSSKIGVHITNPANILTGVHTWNLNSGDGGTGILVSATQTRLLACYYDGNDLVLTAPLETISVEDSFFLFNAKVDLVANSATSVIDGLSIVDNQFLYGGNTPIISLNESKGSKFTSVKQMIVKDNLIQAGHVYSQPRVSLSLTQTKSNTFIFDFKDQLLFNTANIPIAWIDYTVQYNDNSFTPHA